MPLKLAADLLMSPEPPSPGVTEHTSVLGVTLYSLTLILVGAQ